MRRFLVLAVTSVVAVSVYAATAGGSQQAVTPGQFAALSKKVSALQKQVTALKRDFSCLSALGASSFGNGSTSGYHFKQPDGSEILTSTLDTTSAGEAPQIQLAQIDPSCLSSLRLGHASGKVAHRSR